MPPEAEINTDEPSTLAYYNGTHSKALGAYKLKLTNLANGRDYVQGFQVVNHGSMSLIGVAAAEELELVTVRTENIYTSTTMENPNKSSSQHRLNREHFLANSLQVFNRELGCFEGELKLELDASIKPVQCSVRRVPVAMRESLKKELDRLVRLNVIMPVDEPSEWLSPIVVVHKPSRKLRICIDPEQLNRGLKRSIHPVPTVEELMPEISLAKFLQNAM